MTAHIKPDLSSRPKKLVVEQTLRHDAGAIYRAWTQQFDQWFAAPGTLVMTPRAGQPYFFETHFDGQRHPHYGRFLELVQDELIEMTWVTGDPGTKGAETVVKIELAPDGKGTRVRITHAGFADDASRDRHREAWPGVLTHLEQSIADVD